MLLLLFRHSARISLAQEERLATLVLIVTRPHLPRAILVRKITRGTLAPETAGTMAKAGLMR